MKILKNKIPYKIRRILPIAAIAAGSLLTTSCDKDEPEVPLHDTTYVWGHDNFKDPQLKAKIRASADSTSVRNIILKSDGKTWMATYHEKEIRYLVVEPLIEAGGDHNRHKFKGRGTITHINTVYPEDNQWLIDFGYNIIPSGYPKQSQSQKQR